jgi:hypothetical protein
LVKRARQPKDSGNRNAKGEIKISAHKTERSSTR